MFPRGARFPNEKPSEVPGPGHYDIQDPEDKYKRGAFLESTERFDKDKPSDIPGPNAYGNDGRSTKLPVKPSPANMSDRYAALQKKLEDLERVHLEGKKAHQAEQARLKQELSREKRATLEHTEQLAKARKQLDAQDARLQELKKAQATSDTELKELRVKLRAADHERGQLAMQQADAADTRKAAATLDVKRKEELKERDRRITELEKAFLAEQRRREDSETKAAQAAEASANAQEEYTQLQSRFAAAVAEADDVRRVLKATDENQDELVDRVNAFKNMLSCAAQQYGRLAVATVSAVTHARLKADHSALELREARLVRKLANAEDQVQELAYLVRTTKDQNALLVAQLRDAETHAACASSSLAASLEDTTSINASIATDARAIAAELDLMEARAEVQDAALLWETTSAAQWSSHARDLLVALSQRVAAARQVQEDLEARAQALAEATSIREALRAEVARAQSERDEARALLATTQTAKDQAQTAEAAAQRKFEVAERSRKDDITAHAGALQKEKEAVQRATATANKHRLAEEALRVEIEQMTAELMDAVQYQDAYRELSEQFSLLLARSNLAEEEVEKLSHFNAEILGHRNASQKIMYVERIRRELAETKQQLLLATRDHDVALTDNQDLRWELDMYKSVSDNRPRAGITRVTRAPLMNQSLNSAPSAKNLVKSTSVSKPTMPCLEEVGTGPTDMTLDELLPPP